ncbi:MAG: zinc-dependent metalloprotease [Actinobacteria bacterium]|nr:zinc-dependent metalloprotease [Actinomycetota bacterium]
MSGLVDWELAAGTAKRLSPAPPAVSRVEADAVVTELYRSAEVAAAHVAELTALHEPPVTALTRVVDRFGWIDVNVAGMANVMNPIVERLVSANPVGRVGEAVGGRITGAQAGAIMAFLSGKVLGQFEFFDRADGQLLLVAPNLVSVERQLAVDPSDFRLWVCLHEVTHRVQFTAVPWLRSHMHAEVDALSATIDPDPAVYRERLRSAVGELAGLARGHGDGEGIMSILATPEQRAVLDRITAMMSLVEGHAEYVMNAVSPTVIPSQKSIEARFASRRRGGNPLDRLMRRVLGLEAKTRQYVDGAAFVRAVVDKVGIGGFNAVWTSQQTLPTKPEIAHPADWVARVHG